jgi:hypothetical protein
MEKPIVWHGSPAVIGRADIDPRDLLLLDRLGAPPDVLFWSRRDQADVPWTFEVHSTGTIIIDRSKSDESHPQIGPAIDLPDRTASGLMWVRRIVEVDGRIRMEDRWSRSDRKYRRLIDPEDGDVRRLARYLFGDGRWGAGAPSGRDVPYDAILKAIVRHRRDQGRNPTQAQLAEALHYKEVRSLQRALGGSSWRETLSFAAREEEAARQYPGQIAMLGFVSTERAKVVKLRDDSVLRKPRARPESW